MPYIDSCGKLFTHLDRILDWQDTNAVLVAKPPPVTIEWDLSNRCVLGCQDCHFAHTHVKGPWAMKPRILPMAYDAGGDLADTELVLGALDVVGDYGVKGIIWSGGGEPTTHPDVIPILIHAYECNLKQGMYTLGGLVDVALGRYLREYLEWVVVSLDCVDGASYAKEKGVPPERFEAACQGIRNLVGGHAVVGVSFLLHQENWFQAGVMSLLAKELGASYVTFRPTIRVGLDNPSLCFDNRGWITSALPLLQALSYDPFVEVSPERFAKYRDWQDRSYDTCYGIRMSCTITPDGRVWVCTNRRGMGEGSCLGDLRKESFKTIWERHPGEWKKFDQCRVMCKLHTVNEQLAEIYRERTHSEFI